MATNQSLKPVYLILSEQLFLRTQALDRLRTRLEEQGPMDFNMSQYDAESADFLEVVDACNTLPFAVPQRLVIVTSIEKLTASNAELLTQYAKSPSETTVLALVGEKLAKSSRLYKAVTAAGAVLDRKAPAARDLPQTVVGLARQKELTLTTTVAQALINAAGEELDVIELSLEKIKNFIAPKTKVTVNDVAAVVAQTAQVRIWDFTAALFERKTARALTLLQELVSAQVKRKNQRTDLMSIIALTERQTRDCLIARSLIDRGDQSVAQLAKELGKQEWQARNVQKQAKNFSTSQLREALIDMGNVQKKMRTGASDRITFESWILTHFA